MALSDNHRPKVTPKFSIITTCKGRLRDLKQSLPTFLAQRDAEVIVVDYDCPDRTAAYLTEHAPQVVAVVVEDKPRFHLSHARNLGAARAAGEFLLFLDADISIMPGFTAQLSSLMKSGLYGVFEGRDSIRGSCVVDHALFERVGGYDETFEGYGGEDLDFYYRLAVAGGRQITLARENIVSVIEQSTQQRERFRGNNLRLQYVRAMTYFQAKATIMKLAGSRELSPEVRRQIFAMVDQQVASLLEGTRDLKLRFHLPDLFDDKAAGAGVFADLEFSRSILVEVRRKT
jgi:glycosyltransferase involved in cell wall biosynthesis